MLTPTKVPILLSKIATPVKPLDNKLQGSIKTWIVYTCNKELAMVIMTEMTKRTHLYFLRFLICLAIITLL